MGQMKQSDYHLFWALSRDTNISILQIPDNIDIVRLFAISVPNFESI